VPFERHAKQRHHVPKPRYRGINRRDYDAGLRQPGTLTIWFIDDAIAAW
jgi:hypothetical protein